MAEKKKDDMNVLKKMMNQEETGLHKVLKATYIVDAESGPFKTI